MCVLIVCVCDFMEAFILHRSHEKNLESLNGSCVSVEGFFAKIFPLLDRKSERLSN